MVVRESCAAGRRTSVLATLAAAAVVTCASASGNAVLVEDFQGAEPLANWVLSKNSKYANQPVTVKPANITGFEAEQTIYLEKANQHYGLATPFTTAIDNTDKTLVVQYELKLDEILTCGGAYVKLFEESAVANGLENFDNNTPYVIMFGPDKCGGTNKVHFIIRHQNPVTGEWQEKHAKATPAVKVDRKSNLYTLIIRPDNTYEILINTVSEKKGSLLEDMDPPVNPPEVIDDPTDSKPADWVDEAKIPDPEASKPDDWDEDAPRAVPDMDAVKPAGWLDDEADMVADPEAVEPEDWEEEEDGAWEAPLISNPKCEEAPGCGEWVRPTKPNPAYKGKWSAPMIDNPAYKGIWKPKQIPNPAYFKDEHPHNLPKISALAIEIWTTNAGLRFDNFWVGYSEEEAAAYAEGTWKAKFAAEKVAEDEAKKGLKLKEKASKMMEGGWKNMASVYFDDAMDYVMEKPYAAIATAVAFLLSIGFLFYKPGGSKPAAPAEGAAKEAAGDEDEEPVAVDSGVEEKKSSMPGSKKKKEEEEEEEEEDQ